MDIISIVLYGVIQGVAEFLPISSSGHLALLPHVLNISDPGVAFDLAMHVGTAFAVILYFYKELWKMTKELFSIIKNRKVETPMGFYVVNMIFSTFITVIFAYAIKDIAATFGRGKNMIALNLLMFGVLMWVGDRYGKEGSDDIMSKDLSWKNAGLIGLFQAIAVFPGVSRSGATLTISRFLKFSREEASRYSFLLSLPIIIGGFIHKLPELASNGSISLFDCLIGVVISFVVGLITIHFFLKLIKRIGLGIFSLYRIILAALIFFLLQA
jgi:undecaprenyl-diphosphatase